MGRFKLTGNKWKGDEAEQRLEKKQRLEMLEKRSGRDRKWKVTF